MKRNYHHAREPVVLIMDPDSDYGSALIDYYFRVHGLRSVLGFSSRRARISAQVNVPQVHSKAIASRVTLTGDADRDYGLVSRDFDVRAVPAYQEMGVVLAAQLCHRLGLGWNAPEVVTRFRDKHGLKHFIRTNAPDVRINASTSVSSWRDVQEAARAVEYERFVLKPNGGVGNEDVLVADGGFDQEAVMRFFREAVVRDGWLLEEFIDGDEYFVDGQVDAEGHVSVVSVYRYIRGPVGERRNMALGSVRVSPVDRHFDDLIEYSQAVIAATKLRRSPFHMEVKVDESGPCLIECGARLVGYAIGLDDSAAHGGRCNVIDSAAHFWLAEDPVDMRLDWQHYARHPGAHLISNSVDSGIAVAVTGVTELEQQPAFDRWLVRPRVGRAVTRTHSAETIAWGVHFSHHDSRLIDDSVAYAKERVRTELAPKGSVAGRFAQTRGALTHARKATQALRRGHALYR